MIFLLIDNVVQLRRPEPEDIEAMYDYRNDPRIVATMGMTSRGFARADVAEWIDSHRKNRDDLVWTIADLNDRCIGHCGLYKINPRNGVAVIGICIGDVGLWGKGIGTTVIDGVVTYAFQQMNLRKIRAEVLATNISARKLFDKLGFKTEAILREYKYRNGQYLDFHVLSVFRNEWAQRCEQWQPE